jgi:hypothetical protein
MPSYGVQATIDWTLGPAALTAITAYRNWKWVPHFDGDQFGANISTASVVETDQQQFSQELRLASPGGGTIDYTAGLYYFWQEADDISRTGYGRDAVKWLLTGNSPTAAVSTLPASVLDGLEAYAHVVPTTHSYAAYGQATWNVSPVFRLTVGLRYTYEKKTGLYDADQRGNAVAIASLPAAIRAEAIARRAALAPIPRAAAPTICRVRWSPPMIWRRTFMAMPATRAVTNRLASISCASRWAWTSSCGRKKWIPTKPASRAAGWTAGSKPISLCSGPTSPIIRPIISTAM